MECCGLASCTRSSAHTTSVTAEVVVVCQHYRAYLLCKLPVLSRIIPGDE